MPIAFCPWMINRSSYNQAINTIRIGFAMQFIPWILVLSRVAIAPYLLWDAWDGETSWMFVLAYSLAFFSDIFDGIIARRLQMSTARLRIADSIADTLLYLGLAFCTWWTHPEVVLACRVPLLLTIGGIALWMLVNMLKYGKFASYHTYSAKFWGLSLFAATIGIYTGWQSVLLLNLACCCGLVNIGEEILMTIILPSWQHDVLSFVHAWRLRSLANLGD
jgi:phosphatidylglycerophosphate synthase